MQADFSGYLWDKFAELRSNVKLRFKDQNDTLSMHQSPEVYFCGSSRIPDAIGKKTVVGAQEMCTSSVEAAEPCSTWVHVEGNSKGILS